MNRFYKLLFRPTSFSKAIKRNHCKYERRKFSTNSKPAIVLGIETSCDDTGIAIVDSTGKILGQALHSQQVVHLRNGGIIPPLARELHEDYILKMYNEALNSANLELKDIDAIAVTIKPGLELALIVGKDFAKYLYSLEKKPFIPIHHMEAHALTARMVEKVDFPYLVLLISGGHCLIALVQSLDKFILLGKSTDDAPGEAFDKGARRLRMSNLPEYAYMTSGRAIELAAQQAENIDEYLFTLPMTRFKNCNFSFAGIKTALSYHVTKLEEKYKMNEDAVLPIPILNNLCAAYQMIITKHICDRLQRAMEYVDRNNLLPEHNRTLVVSGGVACNDFIAKALSRVCAEMEFRFTRPPKHLCTDNGIMIAWNGVEKFVADTGVLRNEDEIRKIDVQGKAPLGEDITDAVSEAAIKISRVKLKFQELANQ